MRFIASFLWPLTGSLLLTLTGCSTPSRSSAASAADIRAVLEKQIHEWNSGNLAGFMETYAKSDQTHFASGGRLNLGWQAVMDRYQQRYPDAAAMGKTTFSDLEVTILGPDAAMAFGRWHQRGAHGEGSGLFTLILRQTAQGWRIVHDHTSTAAP